MYNRVHIGTVKYIFVQYGTRDHLFMSSWMRPQEVLAMGLSWVIMISLKGQFHIIFSLLLFKKQLILMQIDTLTISLFVIRIHNWLFCVSIIWDRDSPMVNILYVQGNILNLAYLKGQSREIFTSGLFIKHLLLACCFTPWLRIRPDILILSWRQCQWHQWVKKQPIIQYALPENFR